MKAFTSTLANATDKLPTEGAKNIPAPNQVQVSWKNVTTQSIAAEGVSFAYRELGKHNGGTPLVFWPILQQYWITGIPKSWMVLLPNAI